MNKNDEVLTVVGSDPLGLRLIKYFILVLGSFYAVFPLLWIISTSLKSESAVFSEKLELFPSEPRFANYWDVIKDNDFIFLTWFGNSLLVALGTTIVGLFFASTAAYAFSRFRFRGRSTGLFLFLVTQMFPGIILVIPLYQLMARIGLLNSYLGLIIAYSTTALPFCVFMLKGYFDTVPKSLEEAARMDGLGHFQIFWKIMMPLCIPGIVVTGFFSMITSWNEFMLALTFMSDESKYLLPVGLKKYVFDFKTQWQLVSAAAVMVTFPVLAIWLRIQTALMSGKISGSVKG